jgi:hypothetical protein
MDIYEYFKQKYPHMFLEEGGFCGFDCGDGWKDILERLFEKIKDHGSHVMQVKEKFGGLRFYTDTEDDFTYRVIQEAERESFKTCEYCGTKEDVTVEGGWIKTLCKTCRKKRELENG